jgi:DNA-binding PadR family transcriptional regulator
LLRANWFQVLVALADGERHGSAIAEDVLQRTEGALRLWPATLYRTLDDMVAGGLIEELTDGEHPDGESRRKRFYRITEPGRAALADEAGRLASFASVARRRLGDVRA